MKLALDLRPSRRGRTRRGGCLGIRRLRNLLLDELDSAFVLREAIQAVAVEERAQGALFAVNYKIVVVQPWYQPAVADEMEALDLLAGLGHDKAVGQGVPVIELKRSGLLDLGVRHVGRVPK